MQQQYAPQPQGSGLSFDMTREDSLMDKEIQKWLLEVDAQKEIIYHNLMGESIFEVIQEVRDKDGNIKKYRVDTWKRDKLKMAAVNKRGASAIKSKIDSHINKVTLLANINEVMVNRITLMFSHELVDLLIDNGEEWQVEETLRDSIVSDLRAWTYLVLSRMIVGSNDRKLFQNISYTVQRLMKNQEASKTGFLGTPLFGK